MRIGVPDFVSSTHIALIAAKELGLFTDEGQAIDVVHLPLMRGLESLRDGAVDFCSGAAHAPVMIFPHWRGVKLALALMQGTHWMLVMRSGLAKRGDIDAVKGLGLRWLYKRKSAFLRCASGAEDAAYLAEEIIARS